MSKILAPALLLGLLVATLGCNTAPPSQPTRTGSNGYESPRDEGYNRAYESESHRHRHGERRDRESPGGDSWSSYDREEPEPANRNGAARRGMAVSAAPGQFDFYVLNLSWSPEFCYSHPNAAECSQHRAFTLHGLWPENRDGTYPEDCGEGSAPADPSRYADIYPDPALLHHEWQTHGTCSGLGSDQFFALARRADQTIRIPAELAHVTGETALASTQILSLFAANNPAFPSSSFALTCGHDYLTAVEVCMNKNLRAESCSGLRTCRADQVRVLAPR